MSTFVIARPLNENEVVTAVCKALVNRGWRIISSANTQQTGVDVFAKQGDQRIHIEAKGGTSSKETSKRFGKPMTGSQLNIQVGMALWKTAELRSANPNDKIAIALPDEHCLRTRIDRLLPVLEISRIGVLWVNALHTVEAWNVVL